MERRAGAGAERAVIIDIDLLPGEAREIARIRAVDPKAFAALPNQKIADLLRSAAARDAKLRARLYGWRGHALAHA
jgi:hypothetical protein